MSSDADIRARIVRTLVDELMRTFGKEFESYEGLIREYVSGAESEAYGRYKIVKKYFSFCSNAAALLRDRLQAKRMFGVTAPSLLERFTVKVDAADEMLQAKEAATRWTCGAPATSVMRDNYLNLDTLEHSNSVKPSHITPPSQSSHAGSLLARHMKSHRPDALVILPPGLGAGQDQQGYSRLDGGGGEEELLDAWDCVESPLQPLGHAIHNSGSFPLWRDDSP